MSVTFTITRIGSMPVANIKGTIAAPRADIVKSKITVTETTADNSVGTPATYEATPASPTITFTAGIGSTLNATQVDVNAAGFESAPVAVPPFLVVDPTPAVPTGDQVMSFAVDSIS